ncbi:MAG: hypothetical protein GC161_13210 [Planctomycetaceae bacterium]|nr:hypothetical protein [Planctomycetaceae bacterium]
MSRKSLVTAAGWFGLLPLAAIASGRDQVSPPLVPVPTYIVIGQSNAEGYGQVGTQAGQLDPQAYPHLVNPQANVKIFNFPTGTWEPLHATINTQSSATLPQLPRFGPEVSLGDRLAGLHGGPVRILKYAAGSTYLHPTPGVGGAVLDTWDPATGGRYFALDVLVPIAAQAAFAVGESLDVRGVFWIQGTSDALSPVYAAAYQSNLSNFVDAVRADLVGAWGLTTNPHTPFVISQVPRFMFQPDSGSQVCWACSADAVRAAEEAVVCSKPAVGIFDASDISVWGCSVPGCDFVHFDGPGQVAHGEGMFDALQNLGCPTLTSTPGNLSLASGGMQKIYVDAGTNFANGSFLVLGSLSGTSPGTTWQGIPLPLNADAYFVLTQLAPNQPPLGNSLGLLGIQGAATSTFTVPPASASALLGLVAHHAALVVNASSTGLLVTNATGVRFVL